jgi:hypothetical protein
MSDLLIQLVPTMIIQGLMLFGVVPLATRISRGGAWIWIVLTFIPVVGLLTFPILFMRAQAVMLEKIDLLSEKVGGRISVAANERPTDSMPKVQ